jgi:carbonic anhydrase
MPVNRLLRGYRQFRENRYQEQKALYQHLADEGQSPAVMVISCCDSRVDPAIVLNADPGSVFTVRNVANLVPPARPDGDYHGTSAALEFAVRHLQVEHIIVMGHAQCGGVKALYEDLKTGTDFIIPWMNIVTEACSHVREHSAHKTHDEQLHDMEREAIRVSLKNLLTFPWIKERVEQDRLKLYGWYFDFETCNLSTLDQATGAFAPVD